MLVKITPEMAQEWIDNYTGSQELGIMRPIKMWWVTHLAKQMAESMFTPSATIALVKWQKNVCIVNGNHTLRAIVLSNKAINLPVEWIPCKSEIEIRHLYATYDHNRTRVRSDSFRAYDAPYLREIRDSDKNALASAVMFMMDGFGRSRTLNRATVSHTYLLEAMRPWVEPFGVLLSISGRGHSTTWYTRLVRRTSVCSVAIVTLTYQREKAIRFWTSVAEGVNLKKNSPALKLRDYLTEHVQQGQGVVGKEMIQPYKLASVSSYCWNKYYLDQPIVSLRVSFDKPVEILGLNSTELAGRDPLKEIVGYR